MASQSLVDRMQVTYIPTDPSLELMSNCSPYLHSKAYGRKTVLFQKFRIVADLPNSNFHFIF